MRDGVPGLARPTWLRRGEGDGDGQPGDRLGEPNAQVLVPLLARYVSAEQ